MPLSPIFLAVHSGVHKILVCKEFVVAGEHLGRNDSNTLQSGLRPNKYTTVINRSRLAKLIRPTRTKEELGPNVPPAATVGHLASFMCVALVLEIIYLDSRDLTYNWQLPLRAERQARFEQVI